MYVVQNNIQKNCKLALESILSISKILQNGIYKSITLESILSNCRNVGSYKRES